MMINGQTQVLGVIGDPISHSMSPVMHNAALMSLGLDYVYVPFHVRSDALVQAVEGLRCLGVRGFNVTIPHKVSIMDCLDEVDPDARLIGAVNTVALQEGRLVGYNTDCQGFVMPLLKRISLQGQVVAVMGAGGSARAVLVALAKQNVRLIYLAVRNREKGEALASDIRSKFSQVKILVCSFNSNFVQEAVAVINTTPMGMAPSDPLLIQKQWLDHKPLCYDLVYAPRETPFLSMARSVGSAVIDGTEMLVAQGALAFSLWTGHEPPYDLMTLALISVLDE